MSESLYTMLLTTLCLAVPMILIAYFAVRLSIEFDREGEE